MYKWFFPQNLSICVNCDPTYLCLAFFHFLPVRVLSFISACAELFAPELTSLSHVLSILNLCTECSWLIFSFSFYLTNKTQGNLCCRLMFGLDLVLLFAALLFCFPFFCLIQIIAFVERFVLLCSCFSLEVVKLLIQALNNRSGHSLHLLFHMEKMLLETCSMHLNSLEASFLRLDFLCIFSFYLTRYSWYKTKTCIHYCNTKQWECL